MTVSAEGDMQHMLQGPAWLACLPQARPCASSGCRGNIKQILAHHLAGEMNVQADATNANTEAVLDAVGGTSPLKGPGSFTTGNTSWVLRAR